MYKNKVKLAAIFSGLIGTLGFIAKLSPEMFATEKFDFYEYIIRLVSLPLSVLCLFTTAILLFAVTSRGDRLFQAMRGATEFIVLDLRNVVKNWGAVPMIVVGTALIFSLYSGFQLARTAYVFSRDHLVQNYKKEIWARARLEEELRNWEKAEERFKLYEHKTDSESAKERAEQAAQRVQRILKRKVLLIQRAEKTEKIYGENPFSFRAAAAAFQIHPWDEDLRKKMQAEHDSTVPKIIKAAIDAKHQCREAAKPGLKSAAEALVYMGFFQQSELVRPGQFKNTADAFCGLVGTWSDDKLRDQINHIWGVALVGKLLTELSVDKLTTIRNKSWAGWIAGVESTIEDPDRFEEPSNFKGLFDVTSAELIPTMVPSKVATKTGDEHKAQQGQSDSSIGPKEETNEASKE